MKRGPDSPAVGGCWFCHNDPAKIHLIYTFTQEFDSWVHRECVIEALREDPADVEAQVIARELELISTEGDQLD
jgi:hypothetical protein